MVKTDATLPAVPSGGARTLGTLEASLIFPLLWKDVPLVQMVVCPNKRKSFEYLTMLTLKVLLVSMPNMLPYVWLAMK